MKRFHGRSALSYLALLTWTAGVTTACALVDDSDSGADDDGALLGDHQRAIISGTAPDAPEHKAVVALHQRLRNGALVSTAPFCSGTLIAPEVVLTAAHCVEVGIIWPVSQKPDNLGIYIGDDPSVDLLDHLYTVRDIVVHPDYDENLLTDDIALVLLAAPVTEVTPVPALPAIIALDDRDIGIELNFVGFGLDEYEQSGVKLQADGVLGGLGCSVSGCPVPGTAERQISYTQDQGTGGPCFGDSGGPAFVYRDGVAYVAGVTSYGDETCTIYGVSTKVDAYEALMRDYLPVDSLPPSVAMTELYDGADVNSTFAVTVSADDDVRVVRVDLLIDDVATASLMEAPWEFAVAGLTEGAHRIEVVAYDAFNQTSAEVIVNVAADDSGGGCHASDNPGGAGPSMLGLSILAAALRVRRRRRYARAIAR